MERMTNIALAIFVVLVLTTAMFLYLGGYNISIRNRVIANNEECIKIKAAGFDYSFCQEYSCNIAKKEIAWRSHIFGIQTAGEIMECERAYEKN